MFKRNRKAWRFEKQTEALLRAGFKEKRLHDIN